MTETFKTVAEADAFENRARNDAGIIHVKRLNDLQVEVDRLTRASHPYNDGGGQCASDSEIIDAMLRRSEED
jgi:hypothetical protein